MRLRRGGRGGHEGREEQPAGIDDFFLSRVDVAVEEVVPDGVIEQNAVLRHDSNMLAERFQCVVANVLREKRVRGGDGGVLLGRARLTRPLMRITPSSGSKKRKSSRMIVDFLEVELEWRLDGVVMVCGCVCRTNPQPLGPTKATFAPAGMRKDMSSNTFRPVS